MLLLGTQLRMEGVSSELLALCVAKPLHFFLG